MMEVEGFDIANSLALLIAEVRWLLPVGRSISFIFETYNDHVLRGGPRIRKGMESKNLLYDYILRNSLNILNDIQNSKHYKELRFKYNALPDGGWITEKHNAVRREAREVVETILLTWGIKDDSDR